MLFLKTKNLKCISYKQTYNNFFKSLYSESQKWNSQTISQKNI